MSTVGWMSQKRISDLCHSLNETHVLVYSLPPSWVSLWGRGNLLRNTKNKVLTSQKSFVRYRTSNFGLERSERRQVLGICKERIKTVLWKGWKKSTNSREYLPPSPVFAVLKWVMGADLIFLFPGNNQPWTAQVKDPRRHLTFTCSLGIQREFNTGH